MDLLAFPTSEKMCCCDDDGKSEFSKQDMYVMTSDAFPNLVKVGRSNEPERRRLDLSNGQPANYHLEVIFHNAGHLEPVMHRCLKYCRHKGGHSREWFACTVDDVIDAFRSLAPNLIEQIEQRGSMNAIEYYSAEVMNNIQ